MRHAARCVAGYRSQTPTSFRDGGLDVRLHVGQDVLFDRSGEGIGHDADPRLPPGSDFGLEQRNVERPFEAGNRVVDILAKSLWTIGPRS
jgi:hypothetical protein